MHWADKLAQKVEGAQIINDSKTPSGRVHVGALRGVLIHDAIYRALRDRGLPARYLFGVDDYDPLDELPLAHEAFYREWLGAPLCNVPAPPGSEASDVAEHFIGEFFEIFDELGVRAERYRMRDVYRSGRFNESIDVILRNADAVRKAYLEVSGSRRPEDWYPFHAICERCGRIDSTTVTAYADGQVTYTCRAKTGDGSSCDFTARTSPFDGRGKLPWKLEWVAKWRVFGVTIGGAGKDHTTRGGSRDVAARCLREIFGGSPPLNVPYEFFLFGGAKMSSSRGVGATARNVADVLPPEILRFLMIRTAPNRPVEFAAERDQIVKLYNEFDRYHQRAHGAPTVREAEKRAYQLSLIEPELAQGHYYTASFQIILTLLKLPHLDVATEMEKRKGSPLTDHERRDLECRLACARQWVQNFGDEEDRASVQERLPASARELSDLQRGFLRVLAQRVEGVSADGWTEEQLQAQLFDAARLTPIPPNDGFKAVYRAFLDCGSGPRGGTLFAFLGRQFVIDRLREVPFSTRRFWEASAVAEADLLDWVRAQRERIRDAEASLELDAEADAPLGALEVAFTFVDERRHLRRVLLEPPQTQTGSRAQVRRAFEDRARECAARLAGEGGLPIRFRAGASAP